MKTTEIANYLIKQLKANGFIIQYYKAYSSNSIYLKLDYGVANSIRISDHKGKSHLHYRYNLCSHHQKFSCSKTHRDLQRYFYPFKEVDTMIALIVKERNEKLLKYGRDRYIGFIKKNITEKQNTQGFWAQAQLI